MSLFVKPNEIERMSPLNPVEVRGCGITRCYSWQPQCLWSLNITLSPEGRHTNPTSYFLKTTERTAVSLAWPSRQQTQETQTAALCPVVRCCLSQSSYLRVWKQQVPQPFALGRCCLTQCDTQHFSAISRCNRAGRSSLQRASWRATGTVGVRITQIRERLRESKRTECKIKSISWTTLFLSVHIMPKWLFI